MVQFAMLALLALPLVKAIPAPAPIPTPPGVPSTTAAQSELAELTVAAQGPQDGYDRDLFPHWISQGQYVLSFVWRVVVCLMFLEVHATRVKLSSPVTGRTL
jgi:hypothetical protein